MAALRLKEDKMTTKMNEQNRTDCKKLVWQQTKLGMESAPLLVLQSKPQPSKKAAAVTKVLKRHLDEVDDRDEWYDGEIMMLETVTGIASAILGEEIHLREGDKPLYTQQDWEALKNVNIPPYAALLVPGSQAKVLFFDQWAEDKLDCYIASTTTEDAGEMVGRDEVTGQIRYATFEEIAETLDTADYISRVIINAAGFVKRYEDD